MSEEVICNITPPNSPTWTESDTNQDEDPEFEIHKNTLTSRWFVCLGEAKLEKINLHEKSYVQNKEIHVFDDFNKNFSKNIQCKSTTLFKNCFDMASVFLYNSDDLFRALRSEILYLHDAAKLRHVDLHTLADFRSTQDHLKARQNCLRLFLQLREYLSCLNDPRYGWIVKNALPKIEEQLNGFRLFLQRLSDLPEYVLHHCANSQGDKCTDAAYHLFHGHLDMLWLHLTSVYLVDRCQQGVAELSATQSQISSTNSERDSLDHNVMALIATLTELSILRFEKTDVRGLLIKSPFSCSCIAELWLLVIAMMTRLHSKELSETFWTIFNRVMEEFLKPSGQNQKPNCRTLVRFVSRPCSNPYGFTLWFLKHVAMVHSCDECKSDVPQDNYGLLEIVMKGLLTSEVPEAQMRVYLTFVEKILIKYWEPDTKPIVLLWEYFQKRLNSTFYVPGSSVDSIAVMSQSAAGMVKQVKARLSGKTNTDNSFHIFLRILGLYLQRVSTTGQTHHWAQLRGRVYSKLSPAKVAGLTETGLYHLVSLFLTLAITADLSEVSRKLQSLLVGLPDTLDPSARRLVWRSHLAVCLLLAERGQDVTAALGPVTQCLGQPQPDTTLCRTLLEGLRELLDCGGPRVDCTVVVGAWIPKYLADCTPNDSSRLLETLELLLQRVQNQPMDHEKFQSSLWQHLGPYLRRRVSEEAPPTQLADLCLRLCLPDWQVGREVVQMVLLSHSTSVSLVRRFLTRLVEDSDLLAMLKAVPPSAPEAHEVLVLKSWVRCSLLGEGELGRVTHHVATTLPFAAEVCSDLLSAADPLVHFIVNVSDKSRAAQDIQTRVALRQTMSRVLAGLDRWVEAPLRQSQSQPQSRQLGRIYHIVGLIVQLLPTYIYMKSRPNTVLKGLLDVMLLPHAAYKPGYDPPHKAVIAAQLHLYLNGLMDLSKMHDGYIDRCIADLIKIYLPLVSGHHQSKLQECVERPDNGGQLILNTVCDAFIKRKTTNPTPNCAQALKFLKSVVKLYSRNKAVMVMVVDRCFEHVCDVIMFCDDSHHAKIIAREVIVSIFESHCFDDLSASILQKFGNLSREYVPFVPKKLFALFSEVVRHRPELVARFLPELMEHVRRTEERRGRGPDQSLRFYVGELENALMDIRKGS